MKFFVAFLFIIANFAVLGSWVAMSARGVSELDVEFALLYSPLFLASVNHISKLND